MGTSFQYERARCWQAVRTQSTTDPSKYTKATDGRMICHQKKVGGDFLNWKYYVVLVYSGCYIVMPEKV